MFLKLRKNKSDKTYKFIAVGDKKKFEIKYETAQGISVEGKKVEISIEESEDGFVYVIWKNKKYPAEIQEKSQNRYKILINGVSYDFTIETPLSYKRKKFLEKTKVESKVDNISAPMPGKIIDIMVELNSVVIAGESVLILEAMKMQNEILAPSGGRVIGIHAKKDDNVMKDDILIEIEKS